MLRNKNYKKLVFVFVLFVIYSLSIGYSAFSSELSISNIAADIRIVSDVRVTSMVFSSSTNGAITSYENYDVNSVISNVTLPNSNSTITYKVGVTNFGNQEMGIFFITGLPSNLTYEITDYNLHDKICDSTGSCSLGAIKNFYITIKYVDGGFNSSNINYDLKLDFDFRKMHQVTYTGITNNNYPTSVIDGGNLTFTVTTNIPPKIIAFYSNNDRVDYDSYSFTNNVFTYNNVTSDINLKYQEKAYLKTLLTDTDFKESTYKTVIDSV